MSATHNLDAYSTYKQTSDYLRSKLPAEYKHVEIAIICGSGLGGLVDSLEGNKVEFDYKDIPQFPSTTVAGHKGKLVFGLLQGRPTVCMVGRFHFYEGHPIKQCTYPIRVFALLGVSILIVTNAAGGLNSSYKVGDIMVMNDHISALGLAGQNPLIGHNISEFGPRFPATSDAYDFVLRYAAFTAGAELGLLDIMQEGCYCFVAGPSYETRAESRYLKMVGGDAVGMSTVPEVIVARHCGMRVLGLSLITNAAVTKLPKSAKAVVLGETSAEEDMVMTTNKRRRSPSPDKGRKKVVDIHESQAEEEEGKATHEEVLQASEMRAKDMQKLVKRIVAGLPNLVN